MKMYLPIKKTYKVITKTNQRAYSKMLKRPVTLGEILEMESRPMIKKEYERATIKI